MSLAQLQKDIEARQHAVAKIDRQQYEKMLKGNNPDSLNALKAHHERELSKLKTAYDQALGLGGKKPKNQLLATEPNIDALKQAHSSRMDDAYRQAISRRIGKGNSGQQGNDASNLGDMQQSNEQLFWEGFKKGLGLKEGEEVGQEDLKGGLRDIGFAMQDTPMHAPGLNDDETSQDNEEGGQFSSFVYGYSEDNPLLDDPTVEQYKDIILGPYNLSDEAYLKALIGTGEMCFKLGGSEALNEFLENNNLSISEYGRALQKLETVMGDEFNEFISGVIAGNDYMGEYTSSGNLPAQGPELEIDWQDACDRISSIFQEYDLFDEKRCQYGCIRETVF